MLDQATAHVPVNLPVNAAGVPNGKIVRPPFQVPIQLANQARDRLEALITVRHLVQLLPLPLDRLFRRKHIQVLLVAPFQIAIIPKRVSQKVQARSLSQLRNFLRRPRLFHRFRLRLSYGCPSLRNGIFIQAVFSSSYLCMFPVRPLGSTGVTPLLRYYGPPRLPFRDVPGLCLPLHVGCSQPPGRVSQAPRLICPRALPPSTPEGPAGACLLLPHWYQASS